MNAQQKCINFGAQISFQFSVENWSATNRTVCRIQMAAVIYSKIHAGRLLEKKKVCEIYWSVFDQDVRQVANGGNDDIQSKIEQAVMNRFWGHVLWVFTSLGLLINSKLENDLLSVICESSKEIII